MFKPNCAPACEYVAIPLGSSSAAPVIKPGPSFFNKLLACWFGLSFIKRHFDLITEIEEGLYVNQLRFRLPYLLFIHHYKNLAHNRAPVSLSRSTKERLRHSVRVICFESSKSFSYKACIRSAKSWPMMTA